MTPEQIRLKQNPILTNMLLGMGQGTFIAERIFPRLPQTLSKVVIGQLGDERFHRYNLRRAPGTATKRVNISYDGKVYTVQQYSVEVPIPRELIREQAEAKKINLSINVEISEIAMTTANDILALDYEMEAAEFATDPASYDPGNVVTLAGATQWSAATGTPVTDIRRMREIVRQKIGKRPNTLALSAAAFEALVVNAEVRSYLPNTQMGPATLEQLKTVFGLDDIAVGDAVWINESDAHADVWGNDAVLAYVPKILAGGSISLAEPAFGFTNVIEGHPFAETPYYEDNLKSWVYGATFERAPNIAYNTAGGLFQNVI